MHDQSDETQLWSKMQSSFRLESHSCLPHFPIVSLTARFAFTMHTQPLCGQQNRVAAAWKGQHACQSSCAGPRAVHSGWKTPREAASSCCQPPAASLRRSTAACAGGSGKAAAQTTPEREIYPYGGNFGAARRWGGEGGVAVLSLAARPYLSRGPARCPSSAGRRWSRSPGWTPRPRSGPATRRRGRAPARARGSALPPRPPSASPPPPAAAAGAAAPPARPSRHRHRPAPAPPGGGRAAGGDPPRNWGGEWGKAGL